MVQFLLTEDIITMLTEHFFYIKHSFKCFPDNISFNPHNNPIIPRLEIKETGSERLSDLHKVTLSVTKEGFKSKKSYPDS